MKPTRSFIFTIKVVLTLGCIALVSKLSAQNIAPAGAKPTGPLSSYVDPYIGTGFHGHVFMGVNVPFAAVQLGPTNMSEGWDWCSGYHYSDSLIIGFAHTHLSGTGIGDLGDILLMPATGDVKPSTGKPGNPASGYYSPFSHSDEIAKVGYYSVKLKRYNIKAELTATERVGMHRYSFPKGSTPKVIIDLEEGIGWDRSGENFIRKINDTTIVGYRFSYGWAVDQRIFFTAVFSEKIKGFSVYDSTSIKDGVEHKGKRLKSILSFDPSNTEILVKVGISPVSTDNALANIKAEAPGWNFESIMRKADEKWSEELGKVKVTTSDPAQMKVFYTALYHTMIAPSLFNDHNKDYRGTDKKVYNKASFNNLTTFSLWDTYRAAQPLYTILHPEKVSDMANTMLAIYKQQGKLPVWHLHGNETNCMVGNPAIPVLSEAIMKGYKGFDQELAFEAIKTSAMLEERGLHFVKKYGFIPADSMAESVSIGLEYAIADWNAAQVAKKLNKKEDFQYFKKRAGYYLNYFDPKVGFMRGRLSEKDWRSPFSPFESIHEKGDFTEGNSWQYTWLIPHDVEGMIRMLGGEKTFLNKLDSLFFVKGDMGAKASNDITGLIGSYAQGNEPGHHIPYLYAYAGQQWKTAEKVRYIMDNLYTDKNDGLCGNEDVGQMSAWYIFSALGFYPVNPASGAYVFGSPLVNSAEVKVAKDKILKIEVLNNSKQNKYIQKITFDSKPYHKTYIMHSDLMRGGTLQIEMGAEPVRAFGQKKSDRPRSEYN